MLIKNGIRTQKTMHLHRGIKAVFIFLSTILYTQIRQNIMDILAKARNCMSQYLYVIICIYVIYIVFGFSLIILNWNCGLNLRYSIMQMIKN